MKKLLTLFFLLIFSELPVAADNSSEYLELKFDETNICIPKEYLPGISDFEEFLKRNLRGLDSEGQSVTIELPAKLIVDGVEDYTFSHINKHNVDLEHSIRGIANGLSEVTGEPDLNMPCDDKYNLGFCYQRIVYKTVFFQYSLKSFETKNKEKVQVFLRSLFQNWEGNCAKYG